MIIANHYKYDRGDHGRERYIRAWNKVKVSLLVLLMIFGTSCEKVIDINLDDTAKKYVIEGVITDEVGTALVTITQTKDFDLDNEYPGISGALVSITEEGGATSFLTENGSEGKYKSATLVCQQGKKYSLLVTVGGETFTADCTMPQKVNMDSLYVTDEFLVSETRKTANVVYQDPVASGNSYRFIQYLNGKRLDDLFITNDDYTNAREITTKLFFFPDDLDNDSTKIKSGDLLAVDMQCIDPMIYKYWFSLFRASSGGSGQATPTNPVSNIQGGALGYFSAHGLQQREITVP